MFVGEDGLARSIRPRDDERKVFLEKPRVTCAPRPEFDESLPLERL